VGDCFTWPSSYLHNKCGGSNRSRRITRLRLGSRRLPPLQIKNGSEKPGARSRKRSFRSLPLGTRILNKTGIAETRFSAGFWLLPKRQRTLANGKSPFCSRLRQVFKWQERPCKDRRWRLVLLALRLILGGIEFPALVLLPASSIGRDRRTWRWCVCGID